MTKDNILLNALDLFSKKGYHATSIDEIGNACNVKGPAIYRHYKNKEAILNAIIESIEANYAKNINRGHEINSKDDFVTFTLNMFKYTTENELLIKSRMFLSIEQFRDERIGKLLSFHQFDYITSNYKNIFDSLISNNLIKDNDSTILSFIFTSPISLIISLSDRKTHSKEMLTSLLLDHINHFINTYFI